MKNSKRAVKSLERLREDFGGYRYKKCLKHLRMVVRKSGLTLEDIGTSEEELETLRVKGCKELAERHLKRLREGIYNHESELQYLSREVKKGGLTLKDIVTSKEELEKLRVNCCKKSAEEYLKDLREGIYPYNHTLGDTLECLRREVKNGGLTLEDIGISEEELETLRVNCCKKSAEEYLKKLRCLSDNGNRDVLDAIVTIYSNHRECLRREVKNGGLTLKDIGTSKEELETLWPTYDY